MKKLILSILILSTAFAANAQTTFQKTYGGPENDFGNSVQQTTDGGYILFGQTSSFGMGMQDMYLLKTDNSGNALWSQTYGGSMFEFGISAQQTTDGGYILCGGYSGIGNDSLAIIKTDPNGNEVWNKRFSGTTGRDVGQFIQQTTDGGFIAAGFTGPDFTEHIYMVKTDNNGNELWNKIHTTSGRDLVSCIRQTSDGGYAMVGETNSTGFGGTDMLLVKTNSTGDITWSKTFGTSSYEKGRSLYITSDNGFILLGYEDVPGGNLFLVKTDQSGNEQWSNYYGGSGWDMGHSVQQTTDGGYILAGRKENTITGTNDMYCIKINNTGVEQWKYTYPKGFMSSAISVQQTTDGGYILLGSSTDSISGNYDTDMYLVKIDGLGLISVFENDLTLLNLSTYPNPFTEYTTIELNDSKNREFSIEIFNVQGQRIRTIKNITTGQTRIERDNLADGLYFFQLTTDDKLMAAGKLIIK